MSSMSQRPDRSAGFTLGEVLVALAVAAMLATVLTRFVAGTRMNAFKVRELIEIGTLSDSLLERISSQELRAARTDGRNAGFTWHIVVSPLAFTAIARKVNEKSTPVADTGQGKHIGLTPISSRSSGDEPKPAQTQPGVNFIPYHVSLVIEARSGRRYAADTIRIGPAQTDER
jgi:prepilin-type N-terminal cleavage/methylation domain-containing protein